MQTLSLVSSPCVQVLNPHDSTYHVALILTINLAPCYLLDFQDKMLPAMLLFLLFLLNHLSDLLPLSSSATSVPICSLLVLVICSFQLELPIFWVLQLLRFGRFRAHRPLLLCLLSFEHCPNTIARYCFPRVLANWVLGSLPILPSFFSGFFGFSCHTPCFPHGFVGHHRGHVVIQFLCPFSFLLMHCTVSLPPLSCGSSFGTCCTTLLKCATSSLNFDDASLVSLRSSA